MSDRHRVTIVLALFVCYVALILYGLAVGR